MRPLPPPQAVPYGYPAATHHPQHGWAGHGPSYPPPSGRPPKRTDAGLWMVLALFVVVGALVAVLVVVRNDVGDNKSQAGSTSTQTAEPDVTGPTRIERTRKTAASTQRTTTTPRNTTTAPPTSTSAGGQPVVALADNPIHDSGLPGLQGLTCNYVPFASDEAAATNFLKAAVDCLDRLWGPVVEAAGLPYYSPSLAVTADDSPCGTGAPDAFYCGSNATIYMPLTGDTLTRYADAPIVILSILAHEYGHHVQGLSGVLTATAQERRDAGPTTDLGLELSRRLELESQCFAGMYMAAGAISGQLTTDSVAYARDDAYNRGDFPDTGYPRDHGTPENNGGWWSWGYENNQPYYCNTWVSPAADVA